jgi:hypothetical protein
MDPQYHSILVVAMAVAAAPQAAVVVAASLAPQSIVSNGRNIIGKYKGLGRQTVRSYIF